VVVNFSIGVIRRKDKTTSNPAMVLGLIGRELPLCMDDNQQAK
jgi:hypothetical protein